MQDKKAVFFDHDGGVDDYLALLLLLTLPQVDLQAIAVTPADCYGPPAVSATRKICDLFGHSPIPVVTSAARPANPFPHAWRNDSWIVDALPILNEASTIRTPFVEAVPAPAFLVDHLRNARRPVTLVFTGPLTHLALALEMAPDIESQVEELVWMGGALDVPGNVEEPGHDGSAEWNVYWDPPAAHQVWQSTMPITLCPLDATNQAPHTPAFRAALARQRASLRSDLAGQCCALTAYQPYYFWDVLTAAYLGKPALFTFREVQTTVIPTGVSQGRTAVVTTGGRPVKAAQEVDVAGFYAYVLQQFG